MTEKLKPTLEDAAKKTDWSKKKTVAACVKIKYQLDNWCLAGKSQT
ncbi:hypothetical protein [Nostoc sp.]